MVNWYDMSLFNVQFQFHGTTSRISRFSSYKNGLWIRPRNGLRPFETCQLPLSDFIFKETGEVSKVIPPYRRVAEYAGNADMNWPSSFALLVWWVVLAAQGDETPAMMGGVSKAGLASSRVSTWNLGLPGTASTLATPFMDRVYEKKTISFFRSISWIFWDFLRACEIDVFFRQFPTDHISPAKCTGPVGLLDEMDFFSLKLTASLPLKIDPWKKRFRTWKPSFLGRVRGFRLAIGQVLVDRRVDQPFESFLATTSFCSPPRFSTHEVLESKKLVPTWLIKFLMAIWLEIIPVQSSSGLKIVRHIKMGPYEA